MLLYGVAKTPSQFVLQKQFVLPVLKFVISAYIAPGHGPDWTDASTRRANASDQRAGQGWRLVAGSYHRPTRLCGIWVEPARYSYYDLLNLSYRMSAAPRPHLPCTGALQAEQVANGGPWDLRRDDLVGAICYTTRSRARTNASYIAHGY